MYIVTYVYNGIEREEEREYESTAKLYYEQLNEIDGFSSVKVFKKEEDDSRTLLLGHDEIKIGEEVEIIDENDMNFGGKGVLSKREPEWDIESNGIQYKMVKVDFGGTMNYKGKEIPVKREVPYAMHQLKKI